VKICIISSSALPSPPSDYGGLESITGTAAVEFAKLGNDVTLVTTSPSTLAGNWEIKSDTEDKVVGTLKTIETGPGNWTLDEKDHYAAYREMMERDFGLGQGVVWDNTWSCHSYRSIYQNGVDGLKILHTHHGMLCWNSPPPYKVKWPRMMGISKPHAALMSQILRIPVRHVWNGIPLPPFNGANKKGDYLLSLNRIMDEKGIHNCIDVALANRMPIKIVGEDRYVTDQAYVNQIIQTCRNSNGMATYYGLVDNYTKSELLANCKAVIGCPGNTSKGMYMEAFGLFAVEAMAFGKPCIALNSGGLNDIILHGKTGFLAATPEKLKECVPSLDEIEAQVCRDRVEQEFTVEKMCNRYLDIFQKVLDDDIRAKL